MINNDIHLINCELDTTIQPTELADKDGSSQTNCHLPKQYLYEKSEVKQEDADDSSVFHSVDERCKTNNNKVMYIYFSCIPPTLIFINFLKLCAYRKIKMIIYSSCICMSLGSSSFICVRIWIYENIEC